MLEVSVTNDYGSFQLGAEFTAGPGLTALFGRSGSGKTKLINTLAGLENSARGRIVINDKVLLDTDNRINLPPEKRRVGYVFQDARLFPHLSVERNLVYGMNLLKPDEQRHSLDEIVKLLSLENLLGRSPITLSGGEKQRVAIGRALLSSPELLLMDEPLASLDMMHKEEILPFIERLRDDMGIPIIYVSHSIDEVIRLADTMAVMSDGAIAAHGTVEDLMARLDLHPMTGRFEAGAVINTVVLGHDEEFDLTELKCPAGIFMVPRTNVDPGVTVRLRVRARDVSLALDKPRSTSVLNVFTGVIKEIGPLGDAPQVDILIDIGVPLIARITRRSVVDLGLRPGRNVYAMIKAAAIDRKNIGYTRMR
jgi:molybdate transport system ATP-binding protein